MLSLTWSCQKGDYSARKQNELTNYAITIKNKRKIDNVWYQIEKTILNIKSLPTLILKSLELRLKSLELVDESGRLGSKLRELRKNNGEAQKITDIFSKKNI